MVSELIPDLQKPVSGVPPEPVGAQRLELVPDLQTQQPGESRHGFRFREKRELLAYEVQEPLRSPYRVRNLIVMAVTDRSHPGLYARSQLNVCRV